VYQFVCDHNLCTMWAVIGTYDKFLRNLPCDYHIENVLLELWILRKSYLWFYLRIYLAATVHEKAVLEQQQQQRCGQRGLPALVRTHWIGLGTSVDYWPITAK